MTDNLKKLHNRLAEKLLDELEKQDVPAAIYGVVATFLKNNSITGDLSGDTKLKELQAKLADQGAKRAVDSTIEALQKEGFDIH